MSRLPLPLVLLCSLSVTPSLWALESDRQQPVEIVADSAELDESTGEAHYLGNVVLVQGSLSIHADSLAIKAAADNRLERVTALGQPAKFTQTPGPGQSPVKADAKRIVYDVTTGAMELEGDAVVVQDGNIFQGARIRYDIEGQRMQATSGNGGRVKMVLPPSAPPSDKKTP